MVPPQTVFTKLYMYTTFIVLALLLIPIITKSTWLSEQSTWLSEQSTWLSEQSTWLSEQSTSLHDYFVRKCRSFQYCTITDSCTTNSYFN